MVLALPGVRSEVPDVVRRRLSAENLAHALLARVPQMCPNHHQQPTIATAATCEHEASAAFEPATYT
jgi:hypothetical protein